METIEDVDVGQAVRDAGNLAARAERARIEVERAERKRDKILTALAAAEQAIANADEDHVARSKLAAEAAGVVDALREQDPDAVEAAEISFGYKSRIRAATVAAIDEVRREMRAATAVEG